MATSYSPKIITDGLVLALDAGNIKSFRGEPTTNLSNNFRDFTGTTYSPSGEWAGTTVTKTYFSELPTPIGPGATLMTESTSSGYQGLSRYGGSGESGAHSLSAFIYPLTSNITQFTIGLLGDSNNMIFFNLTTGTITYGSGISNRNSILEPVSNWPGWYRIGANFEGRNGGWVGSIGYSMQSAYAGSGTLRSMYITGIQYEQKPYPTPFTTGTRGTTVATGGGWADKSGNSNHGELVNGPTFDSGNGGIIQFDGTNESINIPETSDLDNLSYTYAFWIRRRANQSSSWLQFLQRSTSNRNPGIWFYINEVNRIHFSIRMSNNTNTNNNPAGFLLNEWHYFTATVNYDGTNTIIRSYTDGLIQDSSTLSNISPISGTGDSYIGRQLMDIANLQIYNRALTAAEVLQNYNATRGRFGL